MMATLVIRNLPERATEDLLRERFGGSFVTSIEIRDDLAEGRSGRQAIIELDMTRYEAEQLAGRYQGMVIEDRRVLIAVLG
jgi:hypothetical protein